VRRPLALTLLLAVALDSGIVRAQGESAPLLTVDETKQLEALLTHACRNAQAPTFECSRAAIALFDKIAGAKVPPPAAVPGTP
jgi:hypothetical protein